MAFTRSMMLRRCLLLLAATGCVGHPHHAAKPKGPTSQPTSIEMSMRPLATTGGARGLPTLIHLDVYEVEAPVGDLSQNRAFWSMVNVHSTTPELVRQLDHNGLRCGLAAKDRWPRFRAIFDALPCRVRKLTATGQEAKDLSLDLGRELPSEDIFFIDGLDRLQGRSFQLCTNFVSLGFLPIEGDAAVRISLTPVVRSRLVHTSYSPMNHEYDTPFTATDYLFDVGLSSDVPQSDFMIVGPTAEAPHAASVAGAFFMDRSGSELLEQVLVIVPTYLRTDGRPITLLQMFDRK